MNMKEEYAIVLDFLATGYPGRRYGEPLAQAIGKDYFSLLELVSKENIILKQGEEVYIGDEKRDKIKLVKRRLRLSDLTNIALSNLKEFLDQLIEKNEKRFVDFFNTASSITPRLHKFELLPGIGKKYAQALINHRPFTSFEDIKNKTGISDLVKIIKKRILDELSGNEKYYIFVVPVRTFHGR
ncbi:MAG: DUF655 domain-containing protein [Candidatus Aenigmatarchaeota archaeon]